MHQHLAHLFQSSDIPLAVTRHPTMTSSNTIEISAEGTTPLKYQWYQDDKELRDGPDFDGSRTSKLSIKTTDSPSEGCFKCRVKDKHGKSISSDIIGN